jgi:chemotaxis signal transduction protein
VAEVSKVARKIALTPLPAAPVEVAGISGLKGKVVTVLDLALLRDPKPGASAERTRRVVDAVVLRGTAARADEVGLIIDKPGDILEIAPDTITGARKNRDADFIAGYYDSGGTRYSVIDAGLVASRFKGGGRKNAAERQKGAGNE